MIMADTEEKQAPEAEEERSLLSGYQVKQEVYQGPFDLMLALIDKKELDLYKVSLSDLTKGFIDYIKTMEKTNIVVAGEFLLMAAYLLEMKSKMLLPQPPVAEEEESLINIEEELLARLAEYKIYKGLANSLKERKDVFQKVYTRYAPEEALADQEIFLVDVSLKDLVGAFKRVWEMSEAKEKTREIVQESISVKDKIEEISFKIKSCPQGLEFTSLFVTFSKLEIIVTFLAMLELIKRKMIRIAQAEMFGEIIIVWTAV